MGSYYIYSFDGKLMAEYDMYGQWVRDYIYMGNQLVAEYKGTTYYYYTSDQVNSTRIVTDGTGAVVHAAAYDPYGGIQKTWIATYAPPRKFSGKERDVESGLDYFGARYYACFHYRFASVDPIINKDEAIANPQIWNLYAYCLNNPVSKVDPDGRTVWDIIDVGSFIWSVKTFVQKPSLKHFGELALDTVGLLPVVPALGTLRRVDDAIDAAKVMKKGMNNRRLLEVKKFKGLDVSLDLERGGSGLTNVHIKVDDVKYFLQESGEFLSKEGEKISKSILQDHDVQKAISKAQKLIEKGW